jgi:hypothetical protein
MTLTRVRRSLVNPDRDAKADTIVLEARTVTTSGQVVEHGARVQTPIDRYLKRGQITLRQGIAAELLYRAWATSEGARLENPGCTSYSPSGWRDAQVQAARLYVAARDHVGGRLWPLTFHVCCLDCPVDRVANEVLGGANPTAVMALLRHALDELADSFGLTE